MKKILLTCGIFSSLLYVLMNIFIPMQLEGYNSASQTVSELSAIGVQTRPLWVAVSFVYTLLVIAFGFGVLKSRVENGNLRVAGKLLLIYGIVSLAWPLAPMHQREVLAAGGKTWSDTMHLILAMVTVLLMTLAMGFSAFAFGKRFRYYSILTILVLLVFGVLTGLDAPKVEANLPTPWAGVWERINIGVFLLWVAVLASILLKKENIAAPNLNLVENIKLMRMAQESLKGKWGLAIGTFVIYALILCAFGAFQEGGLIGLLIAGPLMLGISTFSLSISRNKEARLEQMFDGFKYFGNALATYLLMLLYIILWLILLIVPGIIAALSYSMTFYIFADDKSLKPGQLLEKSKHMMNGYKLKLFYLYLRFVPLALLCILTLGIGFLWLIPFMHITVSKFYDDIKDKPALAVN